MVVALSNIFFIVDEAQNLTPLEIKTVISRAGEGTKIVFTGDIHQIDYTLPGLGKQWTELLDRQGQGRSVVRAHHAGERRTQRIGEFGERIVVSTH